MDKSLALCEMLTEAQQREAPFYLPKDNENCFEKQTPGMTGDGAPPFAENGEPGVKLEIFQDARASTQF
jgi:hypothetical protein